MSVQPRRVKKTGFQFDNDLTVQQIDEMIEQLQRLRVEASITELDEEGIIASAFSDGFSSSGDPLQPIILSDGLIALCGTVKDSSVTRHRCSLYTVRTSLDSPVEFWQWEESPTLVESDTTKVDKLRRTVSIHSIPNKGLIIQHTRTFDGKMHKSQSVRASYVKHRYNRDGEITSTTLSPAPASVVRSLPKPSEGW